MSDAGRNVKVIFEQALDCASPAELAAHLDRACAGDTALRARVEALLHAYQQAGHFLQGPTASANPSPTEAAGTFLGPYRILEPLGEGGFGIVYRAEQQQPVRRRVALKVIRPGMDSRQVIARFEAERQALALMDHPHIAKVLDAGEALPAYAGGPPRPYFVMELVEGVPLTDFCDRERLNPGERLALFIGVCSAVQHAHTKGIIHRDLKPSNVLVARVDGRPVVKVIDFGIVKALGQQLTDKTLVTAVAQVIGTPMYMSPEQTEPGAVDIDTRSDIYSLGVLLYELLTGTTPFDRELLGKASFDEMQRIIREEEPPRPSTRISTLGPAAMTLSKQRRTDPRQLGQLLRGELDWIVMKCLEKDRRRRYETADALARDVARYLADEPVEACPPSASYRLGKFLRKHRRPLMTATAFLVLLVAGGVLASWQVVREARAERDRTVEQAKRDEAIRDALDRARALREEARKERDAGKWAKAREQAQRALALVESGPANESLAAQVWQVQEELDEEEKDHRLVADLETARLVQGETAADQNRFADERAIPLYWKALRVYGLPVGEGEPATAVARLRGRPLEVRQAVSAAVDEWLLLATYRGYQAPEAHLGWLRALAVAELDGGAIREIQTACEEPDEIRRRTALQRLAAAAVVRRLPPHALVQLARRLQAAGAPNSAVQLLRRAWQHYPADFWVNEQLGCLVWKTERHRGAEAARHLTAGVALRPDSPGANFNLGVVLAEQGQRDEAIACYRKCIELDPKYASARYNLGNALRANGAVDEAIACFRKAIELDPKDARAHYNLGTALAHKGVLDEAIACYKQAIALDPKCIPAQVNLGNAMQKKGQADEAIALYRSAIVLDPKFAPAHLNLGSALGARGQVGEAIACFQKAIEFDPKLVGAHDGLGFALDAVGKQKEAIQAWRTAVRLEPGLVMTHYWLGKALLLQGRPTEALVHLNEAAKRLPAEQIQALGVLAERFRARQLSRLEKRLPELLAGKDRLDDNAARLELIELCRRQQRFAAAARFFTEVFTAEPRLADDLTAEHRYQAACCAALAAAGLGEDAGKLNAEQRAGLRKSALDWLRADLALLGKQFDSGQPAARAKVKQTLPLWRQNSALAGIRDSSALNKLPAAEQKAFAQLWSDVAALLAKMAAAPK